MAERFEPVAPPTDHEKPGPLGVRLFWFALFALGGLLAVAAAAYFLRALLLIG
ncbi:DUF2474 domain-containing protein [Hyphococcus sp.]|uniref:DUF2474 domain-containing protein n=1 Tax=Hyphococcus sp. TaxID=2038636 RepID=UPI002080C284|nr:MAG: hypothetical protein DHS20C04_02840 [Marinicaulis sp.]